MGAFELIRSLLCYTAVVMGRSTNKKSHLWKLVPYLLQYKWRIIASLSLIIVARLFSVANPYVIKELVDALAESAKVSPDPQYLILLVTLFFGFRWGMDILSGAKDYIFAKVDVGVKRLIALDVFKHLIYLPVAFHADQATGGVARKITRGTSSLSTLSFFFTGSIVPTLIEVVLIIGIFINFFPPIFGIVFFVFVVVYVTFTIIITERRQKLLLETNKRDDRGSEQSIDALINYETVKYFTNESFEAKRYESTLGRWADVAIVATKKGANLNVGQGLIITLGLTALLSLAVREFLAGGATVGDFVLITTYLNRIAIPLSFLGTLYRRLKEGLANVDEMFKLFEVESDIIDKPDAKTLKCTKGHVVFSGVTFGYKKDRTILNNVSINIKEQSSAAIVGYSGSGKSTISKLLLRLYDVQSGSVSVDNVDIKDVTQESLRRHIGVVAQDTILFNDSIVSNIRYGKPDADDDAVTKAAKAANIHDFIVDLPQGYETAVGERGVKLSGGEKQRVAIARMLLKDPPILLFDEATSSLDSKSEKMIQEAIKNISQGGRTTIVIAHRLSTIVDFDKIIVMDKGEVIEEGTHKELLESCGTYQKLWSIQNKG